MGDKGCGKSTMVEAYKAELVEQVGTIYNNSHISKHWIWYVSHGIQASEPYLVIELPRFFPSFETYVGIQMIGS